MRQADRIDAVVRQSVSDADSACATLRSTIQRLRAAPKSTSSPDRDQLLAQADRDGAVTPRVLLPADHADATPHRRPAAPIIERQEPEPPDVPQADDEPGFGTGWLSAR